MKKREPKHPRVVVNKPFDEKTLAQLFDGVSRTAKTARPQTKYEGRQQHDEDFSHLLQLTFEEYSTVVTDEAKTCCFACCSDANSGIASTYQQGTVALQERSGHRCGLRP